MLVILKRDKKVIYEYMCDLKHLKESCLLEKGEIRKKNSLWYI